MKYLLDLDLTLLNTDALKVEVLADATTSFVGTVEFWDHNRAADFLYPDVLPWLKTKTRDSLHLLTAFKPSQGPGAEGFQQGKIECSGLLDYFGSMTVMEGMKGPHAASIVSHFSPEEKIVFVDDLLTQCLSVKECVPQAQCFLIVRKGSLPTELPDGIVAVSSLAEVDAIMNSL